MPRPEVLWRNWRDAGVGQFFSFVRELEELTHNYTSNLHPRRSHIPITGVKATLASTTVSLRICLLALSRQNEWGPAREPDLREGVGLGPDGAIVAEDSGGREALAVDVAEQVVVHVRLPRHAAASLRLSWPGLRRSARSWTRSRRRCLLLSVLCSTYASAAAAARRCRSVHILASPPLNVGIVVLWRMVVQKSRRF